MQVNRNLSLILCTYFTGNNTAPQANAPPQILDGPAIENQLSLLNFLPTGACDAPLPWLDSVCAA